MSMENELKRIADCLERIEAKMNGVSVAPKDQVVVDEGKPVVKRKSTKAVPEVKETSVESEEVVVEPAEEEVMTPQGFLAFCNEKISGLKDIQTKRTTIETLKKKFQEKYGVTSILQIPANKIPEAKEMLTKVMGV